MTIKKPVVANFKDELLEGEIYHLDFSGKEGLNLVKATKTPYELGTRIMVWDKLCTVVEQGSQQDVIIFQDGRKDTITHGSTDMPGVEKLAVCPQTNAFKRKASADEIQELELKAQAYSADKAAKRKALKEQQDTDKAAAQAVLDQSPAWAKCLIVAELENDETDLQSDFHGSSTVRSIALCYSKHSRNLFPEMRKAAKLLPRLSKTTPIDEWTENRQNYSMGGGTFLSEYEYGRYSGWKIRKVSLEYCTQALIDPLAFPTAETPTTETKLEVTEASYQLNEEKNGIEIMFPGKPSEEIRNQLKASRFRWSRRQGLWYAKQSPDRLKLAQELCS